VLQVPTPKFDPQAIRQVFVVRANEAVIAALGSALLVRLHAQAPHAEIRFESEAADDLDRISDGTVTLAIGSYAGIPGEMAAESLVTEQMVVAMRADHPAARQVLTLKRFSALDHIVASRRGRARGPVDHYLSEFGFERRVVAVVPTFSAALAMALSSEAVALVPKRLAVLLGGVGGSALRKPPLDLPDIDVQQIWHGRVTADPTHDWFRNQVRAASLLVAAKDKPLRKKQ
jgi:DNA-binding transcriptional LysR family regulator